MDKSKSSHLKSNILTQPIRILLLGKNGQLGWELNRTLAPLGKVLAYDQPEIDFCDLNSLRNLVVQTNPQVIVNAAAYTNVDQAESEPELAMAVNSQAPAILAEEARRINAHLIHYSTDYVFDGNKGSAYSETDRPNPLNVYGQSKLSGEDAIQAVEGSFLILRTSWVYDLRSNNFVTNVLKWARQQNSLRIVSDQTGNPTWARMLAEVTAQVLVSGGIRYFDYLKERSGIYHLAGSGIASRLQWAQAILHYDPNHEQHTAQEILPACSEEFPTPAKRPLFSALDCQKFHDVFALQLAHWEYALQLAMEGVQD